MNTPHAPAAPLAAVRADAHVAAAPTIIDAIDRAAEAIASGVPIAALLAAQTDRIR